MTEVRRVYKVCKKYIWKAFRVPAGKVKINGTYTVEETEKGLLFTLKDHAPYKVIGETLDDKGKPRYGMIKFVDDAWKFGDRYTVEGNEKRLEIVRFVH